jgi:hypothetical protein
LSNEYANSKKEKIIEKEELSRCKAGSNRQDNAPDVSILTLAYIRSIRPAWARPVHWLVKTTLAQRLLKTADYTESFRRGIRGQSWKQLLQRS